MWPVVVAVHVVGLPRNLVVVVVSLASHCRCSCVRGFVVRAIVCHVPMVVVWWVQDEDWLVVVVVVVLLVVVVRRSLFLLRMVLYRIVVGMSCVLEWWSVVVIAWVVLVRVAL